MTVSNAGPSDAAGVSVADQLPSGYALVEATPSAGAYAAPPWTVGALAANASATLVVTATVRPSGDYANTATATATTSDPTPGNNAATATPAVVGLALVKASTILSDPVNGTAAPKAIPGAIVEYRVTVRNEGPTAIDADSLVLTDFLPPAIDVQVAGGVSMVDGTPASGLAFDSAAHLGWSDRPGGAAPYSYQPTPDASGFDRAVTGLRIAPRGSLGPGTAARPNGVTFVFKGRIK